jgi:hypothetical protein
MRRRAALQLLCCALAAALAASETIVTGSVSPSKALADRLDEPLDLSTVVVEVTPAAAPRLRTRCSPDGSFSIAVPDGPNSFRVASRGNLAFESNTAQVACEAGACNDGQPLRFTVTGLILSGRVVDPDGNAVAGVDVMSDDIILGSTNSQGKYKLSNVKPGRFDIQARNGRTVISPIVGHLVRANDERLPDMVVQLVSVCGKIVYKNETFNTFRRVSVSSDDGLFIDTVDVRFNKFCAQVGSRRRRRRRRAGAGSAPAPGLHSSPRSPPQVKPGKYAVVPTSTKEERRGGLVFRPASYSLTVKGASLEDVDFVQEQTSLVGGRGWAAGDAAGCRAGAAWCRLCGGGRGAGRRSTAAAEGGCSSSGWRAGGPAGRWAPTAGHGLRASQWPPSQARSAQQQQVPLAVAGTRPPAPCPAACRSDPSGACPGSATAGSGST